MPAVPDCDKKTVNLREIPLRRAPIGAIFIHFGFLAASLSALRAMLAFMGEAASQLTPLTTDEGRQQERTHLFVPAAFYSTDGCCSVNIRNMSPNGALIEGSAIAEPGVTASLRHGSLEVSVRIVWKAGRKAGICLSSAIHVAERMGRLGASHQQRVDDVMRDSRTGQECLASAAQKPVPAPSGSPIGMLANGRRG